MTAHGPLASMRAGLSADYRGPFFLEGHIG